MKKKGVKILVVEDDPNLGTILSEFLDAKGYHTKRCENGQKGYEAFNEGDYDMCILDVMMPIKDGFTLAKEIRKLDSKIPIIFLTAKSMKEDTMEGFKSGADDYITKPFSMEELMARMDAIFRRTNNSTGTNSEKRFDLGKFKFDPKQQVLVKGKQHKKLTSKETALLKLLCTNDNDVLDRNEALKAIWGDDTYFNSRSMDVYIAKLRKHFKDEPGIEIINVHGKGFKLVQE